jgi:hypothetical protein
MHRAKIAFRFSRALTGWQKKEWGLLPMGYAAIWATTGKWSEPRRAAGVL